MVRCMAHSVFTFGGSGSGKDVGNQLVMVQG